MVPGSYPRISAKGRETPWTGGQSITGLCIFQPNICPEGERYEKWETTQRKDRNKWAMTLCWYKTEAPMKRNHRKALCLWYDHTKWGVANQRSECHYWRTVRPRSAWQSCLLIRKKKYWLVTMSSHRLIIIDGSKLQLSLSGTDTDLFFKHHSIQ